MPGLGLEGAQKSLEEESSSQMGDKRGKGGHQAGGRGRGDVRLGSFWRPSEGQRLRLERGSAPGFY